MDRASIARRGTHSGGGSARRGRCRTICDPASTSGGAEDIRRQRAGPKQRASQGPAPVVPAEGRLRMPRRFISSRVMFGRILSLRAHDMTDRAHSRERRAFPRHAPHATPAFASSRATDSTIPFRGRRLPSRAVALRIAGRSLMATTPPSPTRRNQFFFSARSPRSIPEIARAIDLPGFRSPARRDRADRVRRTSCRAPCSGAGSIMTNKYAGGLSGKRYYGGCQYVDIAEEFAIERQAAVRLQVHANVQPHSGSQMNRRCSWRCCSPATPSWAST